jgi:hypothetical protein
MGTVIVVTAKEVIRTMRGVVIIDMGTMEVAVDISRAIVAATIM